MAVFHIQLHSQCLQRNVPVVAVLPVDGAAASEPPRPLRALYLLHGISGGQQDWLNGTRVSRYATAHDLAVIMPDGGNNFYVDTAATEEPYGRYVGEELPALCRRMFPLSDRREDTFIGGLSMGGYGAIRGGLTYPDTFGAILAFSSALVMRTWRNAKPGETFIGHSVRFYEALFGPLSQIPGGPNDVDALIENLVRERGAQAVPRILLRCGASDGLLPTNEAYHQLLTRLGVAHDYEVEPGNHEWDFWDRSLARGMDWLDGLSTRA